jgi:serine/threonine-protein kinase
MRYPGPAGGDLLSRRYRLIDRVGAGGMSVVWRARDEVLDRLVAVKWLGAELADDELFRDLVRREAWATARIKHPAVAAVYDYGEVRGQDGQSRAYVVMEMLDGESLAERLRLGPLAWREAIAICAEVADALATAHEQGVVHRDISPDNVMLTSAGVRVFDFGIAAPIGEPDDDSTGSTFGTPAYVAPERLDGQPAQTATDVYALGVLLFEMLTGQPPFPEDTWDPDAARRRRSAPRPRGGSGLPVAVARLCQRCLAYEPGGRPPAREIADRLTAYTRPWWRGSAVLAAAAAAIAIAVAIALAGWGPFGAAPEGHSALPAPGGTGGSAPAPPSTGASAGGPTGAPGAVPTAGAAPPARPSRPPPAPAGGQPPPIDSVSVDQALDGIRAVIDGGVPDQILSHVAVDLHNLVNAISQSLAAAADADVTQQVDNLRQKIRDRSMETDEDGRHSISAGARDELYAAVADLEVALGA